MTNICVIPARGGSQRIPRKNIKDFHGQPIIAYSIQTAIESDCFNKIIVSTDDEEIADISRDYGADVMYRERQYAKDEVGTQEVTARVLSEIPGLEELNIACCLYATSPLLRYETLIDAMESLTEEMDYIMSVGKTPLSDAGQFYIGWVPSFITGVDLIGMTTRMYPVAHETVCDINVMEDWYKAEQMWSKLHGE